MGAKSRPTFEKGYKRNRLVYGLGVNDANYSITNCKIYKRWSDIVRRCVSTTNRKIQYEDCTLDSRWVNFSNFKAWTDLNMTNEGLVVDKDILVSGNKVYGPDTCCLVPRYVNNSVSCIKREGGKYPVGVHWSSHLKHRPFESMINTSLGRVRLGRFASPEEAHKEWQKAKILVLEEIITRYSKESCFNPCVAKRLQDRIDALKIDILFNKVTKEL